jgi:hypothetical protein
MNAMGTPEEEDKALDEISENSASWAESADKGLAAGLLTGNSHLIERQQRAN